MMLGESTTTRAGSRGTETVRPRSSVTVRGPLGLGPWVAYTAAVAATATPPTTSSAIAKTASEMVRGRGVDAGGGGFKDIGLRANILSHKHCAREPAGPPPPERPADNKGYLSRA